MIFYENEYERNHVAIRKIMDHFDYWSVWDQFSYRLREELESYGASLKQSKRYRFYTSNRAYRYFNYREIVFGDAAGKTAFLLKWS